jgi:5-methyltetrahydrofolate--homocysteine methyltransferase
MTTLTSRNGAIDFGSGRPTLLINDQLRVMDQSPDVLTQLQEGKVGKVLELAHFGHKVGTEAVDILVNHSSLDEVALLPKIAVSVHDEIGCPICLDSRDPAALEAALTALQPYKVLINSVTAETESLEALLPIAARFGAAIVGMPIGHTHGLPKTTEGRLAETRVIVEAAERHGIPREDIVIDAICLASSAEPNSMQITLDTLSALHHELGVATILGIGNAGFGMPDQTRIDLAYLIAAVPWGLDAALVDPATPGLVEGTRAIDFLTGCDTYGKRYIQHFRAKKKHTRQIKES